MKITLEEFGKMLDGNAKMSGLDDPIYKKPFIIVFIKKNKTLNNDSFQ